MALLNHDISKATGMFLDKHLEQQFQKSYINRSKNYLQKIALIVGILFFLFSVYDFSANSQFLVLAIIFLCRLIFLVLSLLFYYKPDYFLKSSPFLKITIYEFIPVILFFIIILKYENPHFLLQAFGLNVIILAIFFLVPNLLHYRVFLSSFALIDFLVIALSRAQPPILETISVVVYLSLSIFISSISSYSAGKYMRLDYVHKQFFKDLSMKDTLTDTYNRLKFNESLRREIELARRYGNTFSLIMFDIDHFKQFNDQNGHIFGDKVLIEITNRVKGTVREVDLFARWGGEEFVILLPQTDCEEASALAERLRQLIYLESLKKEISITCSFGVTSSCSEDDEGSIMERVDKALYRAKECGRNVVVAEHGLHLISSV